MPDTDWSKWSRDAVSNMQARNTAWMDHYSLQGVPYLWKFDPPEIVFRRPHDHVAARLIVVGSVSNSEGTFLWSWANDSLPAGATAGMFRVRQFGEENGLGLLSNPWFRGGRPEGLEMLAIACRILDANGAWVAPDGDITRFFALFGFAARPRAD